MMNNLHDPSLNHQAAQPSDACMSAEDRHLIERAAKAAGLNYKRQGELGDILVRNEDLSWRPWNPLCNKADAMELVISLDVCLTITGTFTKACRLGGDADVEHDDNKEAAILRAITLTAAGRQQREDVL